MANALDSCRPQASLSAASGADFSATAPLSGAAIRHPYAYLLFLGPDGQGNMLPCRQLRDKYCVQRKDVYAPGGWCSALAATNLLKL